jgi:transposase
VRENDGRKLDHRTLERLRLRTVQQIAIGQTTCPQAAQVLGLAESTVYAWWHTYRSSGAAALNARPIPGAKRKLTDAQMAEMYDLIVDHEPADHELEAASWTRDLVRRAVIQSFGVELTLASIGRTLHDLGLTTTRLAWRNGLRTAWHDTVWPALRTQARTAGAALYSLNQSRVQADRRCVNMISAAPPKGTMRFSVFSGPATAIAFLEFLGRLLRDVPDPLMIITDNAPIHHAKVVAAWLDDVNRRTPGRVRLVFPSSGAQPASETVAGP